MPRWAEGLALAALTCIAPLPVAFPVPLAATQARLGTEVRGQVRDSLGQQITGVRIIRNGGQDTAWSDAAGRFRFDSLPHGLHEFVLTAVGYRPASFEVALYQDTTLVVDVTLEPVDAVLDAVTVVGERVDPDLERIGFLARRRLHEASDATFLGPDEIESRRALRLGHLLQSQRNIRIDYQGQRAIPRGRGGRCVMSVWLDGQQVRGLFGEDGAPPSDATGLDVIPPSNVKAVEVYPSPSSTPPQFQTLNNCGAIVLWTK